MASECDGRDRAQSRRNRLTTFRPPSPSPRVIKALAPVNRAVMLQGLPFLNRIPYLRRVPGIGGVMQIPQIAFEHDDRARLQRLTDAQAAVFLTPNHPEFFTDWMLDKYVMSLVSPLAASWATHEIVNGLGKTVQTFWLKNNLIAQIPGEGGQAGKAYSVRWAREGHGVLLHPEGSVAWHSDRIGRLFPGAAEMALETARQLEAAGEARETYIAPVVWKLFFREDVSSGLHREAQYIESRLRLPRSSAKDSPADRVHHIYGALLARDEIAAGIHPTNAPYAARRQRVLKRLKERLSKRMEPMTGGETADDRDEVLGQARRWLRTVDRDHHAFAAIKTLTRDINRISRFDPVWYVGDVLTQEHVAESLKRLRADYCRGSKRDAAHNYVPVPVGARRAVIRVPEPIEVTSESESPDCLTESLRARMQTCLDDINADNLERQRDLPVFENPFLS